MLPSPGISVDQRKTKGCGNSGDGKTYHKALPPKRFWTPHLRYDPPPPVHTLSFSLEGTGTDQTNPFSEASKTGFGGRTQKYVPPPPFEVDRAFAKGVAGTVSLPCFSPFSLIFCRFLPCFPSVFFRFCPSHFQKHREIPFARPFCKTPSRDHLYKSFLDTHVVTPWQPWQEASSPSAYPTTFTEAVQRFHLMVVVHS